MVKGFLGRLMHSVLGMTQKCSPMLKLVLPNLKYRKGFVRDFLPYMGKSRIKYESLGIYLKHPKVSKDFSGFVKYVRAQEKRQNLPKNYVPQTAYWLVEGDKALGWLSLRHYLNKNLRRIGGHIGYEISPKFRGKGYGNEILRLGLLKAAQKGIKKVFITCDEDNIRSKKIIERNGGVQEGKVWQVDRKCYKLRYWITTC